jgi:hypothetical protein
VFGKNGTQARRGNAINDTVPASSPQTKTPNRKGLGVE